MTARRLPPSAPSGSVSKSWRRGSHRTKANRPYDPAARADMADHDDTAEQGTEATSGAANSDAAAVPGGNRPPTVARGVFEFEPGKKDDQFNLKPRDDRAGPIPEEQRK